MKNKFKGYVYKKVISPDPNNMDSIIPVEVLDRHQGQVKIGYAHTIGTHGTTFKVQTWIEAEEYHVFFLSFEELSDEIHKLKNRIAELEKNERS